MPQPQSGGQRPEGNTPAGRQGERPGGPGPEGGHGGKRPSASGFFKLLKPYYKKHWFSWILFTIATLISVGVTVALPKLTNIIMNDLTVGALARTSIEDPSMKWSVLIYWAIGFGSSFIVSGISLFLINYIGGQIAKKIEIDIRIKVLNKLMDIEMNYYHDKKMGDILTRLISDTQIVGDQAYQVPQMFVNAFFTFFGSVAIMFTLDNNIQQYTDGPNNTVIPMTDENGNLVMKDGTISMIEISAIIIGVTLAIIMITGLAFITMRKLLMKQRTVISNINGDVNDRLNAIRLVKASATNQYEKNRFKEIHKSYYKVSMKSLKVQAVVMGIVFTVMSSMNIIAIIIGIIFVNLNKLDPAVMLSITMSINSLVVPVLRIFQMLGNLASASTSSARVQEIMDATVKIDVHPEVEPLKEVKGNIIFKNVSFKYDEEDEKEPMILENFNFTFEEGKSYAFVGETGVGKSTISKLLLRYYDPTKGDIYVNGDKNLKDINLKSYLDHVGYVEQEPQIIYGTFFDNIRYGTFDATDEDCIEAAKKANLYDFINGLPEGFNTVLGERGFILSGGQKQRMVIARMFLRNPKVLILDEATSALDNIVEKEIQAELDKLSAGRTTIVIAHRLSTIQNVDEILVLEKGKGVSQSGTFNDLKNKPGRFKLLYEAGLMS